MNRVTSHAHLMLREKLPPSDRLFVLVITSLARSLRLQGNAIRAGATELIDRLLWADERLRVERDKAAVRRRQPRAYSITSSVWASSVGGMLRPRA